MGEVIVVGSGAVGLFSAYYLNRSGFSVKVVDRNSFGTSCSFGNAGMIVPSHFIPLASPGVIAKGLKWLMSSESPLSIKPDASIDFARWLWLFYRSSGSLNVSRSSKPLLDLHIASRELYKEISAEIDTGLRNDGILILYNSAAGEKEELENARMAMELGLDPVVYSPGEVEQIEPDAGYVARGGVLYPMDSHLDPVKLMISLKGLLKSRGVTFAENCEIRDIAVGSKGVESLITSEGTMYADGFVLAAGRWSGDLAGKAGARIPHMAGKGYSFVTGNNGIRHAALLHEARISVTPYGKSVRFGGTMEIGNVGHKTNRNKINGMIRSLESFLPSYNGQIDSNREVWSGMRSLSPDGLPYIGKISPYENLLIASGHGMMGISLAPVSGKIIAELATGGSTGSDISVFDPMRFS